MDRDTSEPSRDSWRTCGTVTHATPPVSSRRSPGDVAANGRLAQLGAVAVDQPLPDPPGGVPLLLGEHLIGGHPVADQRLPRPKHRRRPL